MSDPLQDRIARGQGIAARKLGLETDAYRPSTPDAPLSLRNRYILLPVVFHIGKAFDTPAAYGNPLWQAMLDSAYTKPGDYLVQRDEIWFIASQPRLLPVLCVKTNRVVSFTRAAAANHMGVGTYTGMQRATQHKILTNWPASVLATGAARMASTHLPADLPATTWTVLLPALPTTMLHAGDRMSDDLNRAGIITTADLTDFGWRLIIREAAS